MTIECLKFVSCKSGSLIGFADFRINDWGLEIYGCPLYMKAGKRWVNLPSKEYVDKETNEKKYAAVIRFPDKKMYERFQDMAKKAIDEWCEKKKQCAARASLPENKNRNYGNDIGREEG